MPGQISFIHTSGWRVAQRAAPPYTGRVRSLATGFACLALALLAGSPAAAQDERRSLQSLIASSDLIVVGKISRTAQVERENDLHDISYNATRRYIAIVATITVEETLLGEQPGATVKFAYPKRSRVKGEPVYDANQDGIWLLRKSERPNEYLADEIGRFQSRERKEQLKTIIGRYSIKNVGDGKHAPEKP